MSTRCARCGKSTRSPKATVCGACLERSETLSWLTKGATRAGECLLARLDPHSDGRYRVTCMSRDGMTKSSSTLQALVVSDVELTSSESLRPTCGQWSCLVREHWVVLPRETLSERLRHARALLTQAVGWVETAGGPEDLIRRMREQEQT